MIKSPIKWVGGKSKLFGSISAYYPAEINNYHELFVGGCSALLGLLDMVKNNKVKVNGKIYAYDSNEILIAYYKFIQSDYSLLYETVMKIKNAESDNKEEYYYSIRTLYNDRTTTDIIKVAQFVYMNKTGFRGVFRLNRSGGFNVPYGHYKNPTIVNKEHLKNVSLIIQNVEFICCDFEEVKTIKEGDFVYMDPPYVPEKKGGFVNYGKAGFVKEKHEALFKLCNSMKCKWVLSNSNVETVKQALKKFNIQEIDARRAINSTNPAATTKEVIIYN